MANNIQQRLLDLAVDIAGTAPEEITFHHSIMTQASLPTSRPPNGVQVWERQQGRARLRVEAGSVLDLRWSRPVGQFGGPIKLGPGCRQAASLSIMPARYASSGVRPANVECGRRVL